MKTIFHFDIKQGTKEWDNIRLCVVSGTRFCNLLSDRKGYYNLLDDITAEILTGLRKTEKIKSAAIDWGLQYESEALSIFPNRIEVGFISKGKLFGMSPDSISIDKTIHYEAKCPNSSTLMGYIRVGTMPLIYIPQIVSSFVINDLCEKVIFVAFDPRNNFIKRFILEITRDTKIPLSFADTEKLEAYKDLDSPTKTQINVKNNLERKSKKTIQDLVYQAELKMNKFEQDLNEIINKHTNY